MLFKNNLTTMGNFKMEIKYHIENSSNIYQIIILI